MKTTVIKGKQIAAFDQQIVAMIEATDTTMRQIEKEGGIRIGIRNEQGQIYRAIGSDDEKLWGNAMKKLHQAGFIDELDNKPSQKGYDAILKLHGHLNFP